MSHWLPAGARIRYGIHPETGRYHAYWCRHWKPDYKQVELTAGDYWHLPDTAKVSCCKRQIRRRYVPVYEWEDNQ